MNLFDWIKKGMWKKYEKQIAPKVKSKFPNYDIRPNDTIRGKLSKVNRQVDISLKKESNGKMILGIAECKCFGRRIDVKQVDSFAGFLKDVDAQFGLMITNKGFSKGAKNRAIGDNIDLEVIKFSDWDSFNTTWFSEGNFISANNLVVRCLKCNNKLLFNDDELTFNVVEVHERSMGSEIYYHAYWEGCCDKCNNGIRLSLEIIEYPVGQKTLSHAEIDGCELLKMFDK